MTRQCVGKVTLRCPLSASWISEVGRAGIGRSRRAVPSGARLAQGGRARDYAATAGCAEVELDEARLYRSRLMGHHEAAYAASAAGESRA